MTDHICLTLYLLRPGFVLGRLSRRYFGKSVSWFYNKLNGIDGNGGEGGFTHEELQQLKGALCDLADRIRRAADNL